MSRSFQDKLDEVMKAKPKHTKHDRIAIWRVRGADDNPDFGGRHDMPVLGYVKGTYEASARWAVKNPRFESWGLGDIKEVEVIDLAELPVIRDSGFQNAVTQHLKACSYRMLANSGVPLDGLLCMVASNFKGLKDYTAKHFKNSDSQIVDGDLVTVYHYLEKSVDVDDFLTRINRFA